MSTSLFKKPLSKAKFPRNGFDLSQRRLFTAPCGMLLPFWQDLANPGDKYRFNNSLYIRTEALQTAAFMRLKAHVELFFVPMQQIYKFWNEFYNGTNDVHTSLVSVTSTTQFRFPYFSTNNDSLNFDVESYIHETNSTLNFDYDEFGTPLLWNLSRLWDLFGYGSRSFLMRLQDDTSGGVDADQFIDYNLLPFWYLAYHRIFYSYYMNNQWFKNDPSIYNVDVYRGGEIPNASVSSSPIRRILSTIHYRPYRVDYFTNIQPSPVFNPGFANSIGNSGLFGITSTSQVLPNYPDNFVLSATNSGNQVIISRNNSTGGSSDATQIPLTSLRAAFAYDKLLRVTAQSGSHYHDQILAHFGFSTPEGIRDEAYHIGSYTTDININEVVATASTGVNSAGGTIGDIAGKGFAMSGNNKDLSFTAPCHGIMMALFSIEPIVDYASLYMEAQNRYSEAYDFFHPEFDNIGMVPLYNSFAFRINNIPNVDTISGWTYRYSELKTKVDVVNEGFFATDKNSWVGYKQNLYPSPMTKGPSGSDIVSPRLETLFYIAPQYTNSIFLQSYPDYHTISQNIPTTRRSWSLPELQTNFIYQHDNFLICSDTKAYKTSVMSVHSLPKIM